MVGQCVRLAGQGKTAGPTPIRDCGTVPGLNHRSCTQDTLPGITTSSACFLLQGCITGALAD